MENSESICEGVIKQLNDSGCFGIPVTQENLLDSLSRLITAFREAKVSAARAKAAAHAMIETF